MATPFAPVLPALSTFSHVTNCSQTITPYFSSLTSNLHFLQPGSENFSPSSFYHNTNPAITAIIFSQALALCTFILSTITGNWSQVDRLWTLLPAIYIAHFTYYAHFLSLPTARLDTLLTLVVIWSARLTFHFFRRGGYNFRYEDYRWAYARRNIVPQKWKQVLFNFVFISWFQNALLLLLSMPAYLFLVIAALPEGVVTSRDIHAFGTVDLIFSRALMLALIAEFFADQQQWGFQQAKKAFKDSGKKIVPEGWNREDLERGFCVVGLWSFSRHPNFVAEQTFWILMYQWCCFGMHPYLPQFFVFFRD